jgi:hypothetical protein
MLRCWWSFYFSIPDDFVKNSALIVLATSLLFAGCSKQEQPQSAPTTTTPAPVAAPAPAPQPPKATSPERIAEIEASGKTGMWATVTKVCPAEAKAGLRTTLVWNVKATGANRVILYVVDPNGKERNFGQGGAVGERETGPWLRPGRTFRIRNYDTKDDLGTVVIGGKSC